jgi:hypothetical protein
MHILLCLIEVAVHGSETILSVPLNWRLSLCCYMHNSKVNQHIGVENNVAEAAAE